MTGMDIAFLILALAAFTTFALVLAWANRQAP